MAMGIFGATVTGIFNALPSILVLALAGIALLGTLGSGLASAFEKSEQRDAAIVTFLLTGSGITLLGIGRAFWGLVAGLTVLKITSENLTGAFKRGVGIQTPTIHIVASRSSSNTPDILTMARASSKLSISSITSSSFSKLTG